MQMSEWLTWQFADSAFPTGAFAHSWGLEAAWQGGEVRGDGTLRQFVADALWQTGRGALPLLTAAYTSPSRFDELDRLADVFLVNTVTNRASRVQGRAFLTTCARIWPTQELQALEQVAAARYGHIAPVSGAVLKVLGLPLDSAQHLFLYNAARGICAAAVRLGIVGSYQAQRLQYESAALMDRIVESCGSLDERSLAQTAPIVDVLQASHDRLYSRLFQS